MLQMHITSSMCHIMLQTIWTCLDDIPSLAMIFWKRGVNHVENADLLNVQIKVQVEQKINEQLRVISVA